jgi:phage tail sheath gpL-like
MPLTGVDPNDPTPLDRREFILGAGPSSGTSPDMKFLIFGNKTSAGSETVDTLGTPIVDDADCRARFGNRSEVYAMYRKAIAVDPTATYYAIAVTESAGNSASADFTFATSATANSSVEIEVHGEKFYSAITSGDDVTTIAAAVVSAINAADDGRLMVTAGNVAGVVTVTASQKGPRFGTTIIGSGSTRGVRMRIVTSCGTTVSKGALSAGTVEDDGTAAFAAADAGEFHWIVPWYVAGAITATDNQIGEAAVAVVASVAPTVGKFQTLHVGLVATQANATTTATDAQANSTFVFFYHAENNDWTPGMIAAHFAAICRRQYMRHPAASWLNYSNGVDPVLGSTNVLLIPDPYVKTDRATAAEIRANLNNGVTPVAFRSNGTPYVPRHITSRSLNAAGNNDYRARSGHLPFVSDFIWKQVLDRYSGLPPFMDNDQVAGKQPVKGVTTPSLVKQVIFSVLDEAVKSRPSFGGTVYDGPILAPSLLASMKERVLVAKSAAGFTVTLELNAVEHRYKSETKVLETSAAY